MRFIEYMIETSAKGPDQAPLEELSRLSRMYNFSMDSTADWDQHGKVTMDSMKAMMSPRELGVYTKKGELVGKFKSLDDILDLSKAEQPRSRAAQLQRKMR
jgi:hypothetical protein